jgi:uncharacterized protein YeaO (DUF488 family)
MKRLDIRLKRAYEPPKPADGQRVLVDGLWPRGLSKNSARIDLWLKEIAPSASLRKWFGHEPEKWNVFRTRYFRQLRKNPEAVARLEDAIRNGTVTLLFAAKDGEHNNAVALKEYLESGHSHDRPAPR